jgi:hypothetical protein
MGAGGQGYVRLYSRGRDPVPNLQESVWDPGPVWTGVENLSPSGIRSPDSPAYSEWLYRLSYRGPHTESILQQ